MSPIDKNTANNLKFLIGLRHEIEHQMTLSLDDYLSGRYQACILNYNHCKGYDVEVAGCWYWYETWLNRCIELCDSAGDKYK